MSGERPLTALRDRGVEYVEVRCLDLNPFLHVGIDVPQSRFIDTFLLYCLLGASPPDSRAESLRMAANQLAVVERGRQPGLELELDGSTVSLRDWGRRILDGCRPLAELLDRAHGHEAHTESWLEQQRKLEEPDLTPSARVLEIMSQQRVPFFRFAMNQSVAHKGWFLEHPLMPEQLAAYRATASASLDEQRAIEAADSVDFDTFLESYLALA
jgi:glutamate--cysteine ligase